MCSVLHVRRILSQCLLWHLLLLCRLLFALTGKVDAASAPVEGSTDGHRSEVSLSSSTTQGAAKSKAAARARSASVSVETAEALASALAGSSRDMEVSVEELTCSSDDDSDDDDLEFRLHSQRRKRRGLDVPDFYVYVLHCLCPTAHMPLHTVFCAVATCL